MSGTRSRSKGKRTKNKSNKSSKQIDESDPDYDISDSDSESAHTAPLSSGNATDTDDMYDPKTDNVINKKSTKSNPRHKMSVDESESESDEGYIDHIYEDNDDQVLPKSVVYLQYDENSGITPNPTEYDIFNDTINHNPSCKDPLYIRNKAMHFVMNKIEEKIDDIIERADHSIFNKIVQFAQNSYSKQTPKNSMNFLWSLHQNVIPTAMLMCGSNVSDHTLHFQHLQHELETNVSPLIVRFTANDLKKNGSFSSRLYDVQRFIVHSIFKQLCEWKIAKPNPYNKSPTITNVRKTRVSIDRNIENMEYYDMKRCLKIPPLNSIKNEVIRTFVHWYFNFGCNINKYWTKNDYIKSCWDDLPKIVVMLDGIEQWSPDILSSLIYTLHAMSDNYHDSKQCYIPFILVLGVSRTEDLLSRMVEFDALRLLSVQRFYFKAAHTLYMSLAEEILIETSPILFGENILHKLLSHCQLNDYSVSRFKEEIRYLFMSYFMNTTCCQYSAYLMYIKEKEKDDYDYKARMECIQQWWIDNEIEYITELLENGPYHEGDELEMLVEYVEDTYGVYQRYRDALKVFKMITDHLDFKWSSTEIIAKLQNKEVLFKHLLCRVGAEHNRIKISTEERAHYPERINNFSECLSIFKILEQETKLFDDEFSAQSAEEYKMIALKLEQKAQNNNNNIGGHRAKKRLNAKQQRTALKRQLTQQTKKTIYDDGRKHLYNLLIDFIHKHLKPMNELPLHELFVYNNEKEFSENMLPPTNSETRRRYEEYREYFDAGDDIEAEAMSSIYDVYKEMDGLYLNLHDAYIAFKERFANYDDMDMDEEEKKKKKKKKKKKRNAKEEISTDEEDNDGVDKISEKEKRIQMQFRLSIDDLRFCGFAKSTNRRIETLMKMADLV